MPTTHPTGYETYIYDHRQFKGTFEERREHCGKLHDPNTLPAPTCDYETAPLIMVEPSYASFTPDEVYIHFRAGHSVMLKRELAEQLRDALIKVCTKPKRS